MMCQHGPMARSMPMAGRAHDPCGCGCGLPLRRFVSSQEEQECLEGYSDQLKKELAGVEERIKELSAK